MRFTREQIMGLAPDAGSAANGKKLANTRMWRGLGQNAEALWGECQGSALYQVRVELATLVAACSCPSHKFPCKHGLGLLLLALDDEAVPQGEPPEWVSGWLAKRAAAAQHAQHAHETHEKKAAEGTSEGAQPKQAKRAEQRDAMLLQGLDRLDLWMNDVARTGLAGVERQSAAFWERQAAQLVDAQAPGVAARVRRCAEIAGSSPRWPEVLLGELGKLALLTHTYRRVEALDAALRADVRGLIGDRLKREDVTAQGERTRDVWLTLGQLMEEQDRLRTQRTWLLGAKSEEAALIVQHAFGAAAFGEVFVTGGEQEAELAYYPGAARLRAQVEQRYGEAMAMSARPPGVGSIEEFLASVARRLARQPWQERFLCVLHDVAPAREMRSGRVFIRDGTGAALRLRGAEHWRLLALSGGAALDFAGEWDGEQVTPLGVFLAGAYTPLGGEE